jgi:hypothetical protein
MEKKSVSIILLLFIILSGVLSVSAVIDTKLNVKVDSYNMEYAKSNTDNYDVEFISGSDTSATISVNNQTKEISPEQYSLPYNGKNISNLIFVLKNADEANLNIYSTVLIGIPLYFDTDSSTLKEVYINGENHTVEFISGSDSSATIQLDNNNSKEITDTIGDSLLNIQGWSYKRIGNFDFSVIEADENNLRLSATVLMFFEHTFTMAPEHGDCTIDSDCNYINGSCGKGVCNITSNRCQASYNSTSDLCRPAADDCDAAEYCTGFDLNCPSNINKTDKSECSAGSCQNGKCIESIACYNDEDCIIVGMGSPQCKGNQLCIGAISYSCINPGTSQSHCNASTHESCQICEYGCQNNQCNAAPTPSRECEPVGIRQSEKYCDLNYEWKIQKRDSSSCENAFECQSNICKNKACGEGKINPPNPYGTYVIIAIVIGLVIIISIVVLTFIKSKK